MSETASRPGHPHLDEPPLWGLLRVQEAPMSVQNIGILATLIGLIILAVTAYTGFGLTLLLAGAVVAIVGIITRK